MYVPYWGNVSATIDWCEQNYKHSSYIAEWFNSWSNLNYFLFATFGLANATSASSLASFLGIAIVGLGSFAFHASLTYYSQLCDELPMVYATLISLYASMHPVSHSPLTALAMSLYSIAFTAIYIYYRNPVFHQIAYGICAFLFFAVPIHQMQKMYRKHPIRIERLARMYCMNAASYLLGFVCWNLDNNFCEELEYLRLLIGIPGVKDLLQLHAWWHLGTGYGCYGMVVHCQLMQALMNGEDESIDFEYMFGCIPVVVKSATKKKKVDDGEFKVLEKLKADPEIGRNDGVSTRKTRLKKNRLEA